MTRQLSLSNADAGPADTAATSTRARLKRYLMQRFYTRFHMTLILSSSTLAAMLTSWSLLKLGATSMLARYPIAVVVSYAVFLGGVWLWLRYVEAESRSQDAAAARLRGDGSLLPNFSGGGGGSSGFGSGGSGGSSGGGGSVASGGGGEFGGGGAGGSWLDGSPASDGGDVPANAFGAMSAPQPKASSSGSGLGKLFSKSSGGSSGGGSLDLDDVLLLLLAVALIATIFVASGYLIWAAPDILTEAVFGATLAGGLTRRAKREDATGWITGIVKKTWWPFALVLVMTVAFASFAGKHFPSAYTFRQAVSQALN